MSWTDVSNPFESKMDCRREASAFQALQERFHLVQSSLLLEVWPKAFTSLKERVQARDEAWNVSKVATSSICHCVSRTL